MNKRDTLLLACGTTESRGAMRAIFEESFNLLEADNSQQVIQLLEQNSSCIAAVLVDVTAPEKIDRKTFSRIANTWSTIPAIVIADENTEKLLALSFSHGAVDVIPLKGDPYVVRQRVHNIVELYVYRRHLEELLQEQEEALKQTNQRMVDALSSIIEHRSAESGQHILRIRSFTQILLEEVALTCPEYGLTQPTIRIISSAAAE